MRPPVFSGRRINKNSMNRISKGHLVFFILTITFFVLIVFLPYSPFLKEEVIFKIEKGEGSKEIAHNLEKQRIIASAPFFRFYVLITGDSGKLQAGSYFISSSMNVYQIADKFIRGDIAETVLTIPEGFDSEQIYQKLKGVVDIDLSMLEVSEGYLFPDTYRIPFGGRGEYIVKMMTDNFNKKVGPDLEEEIRKQKKTLEDVVIMASLLEKEVRTKEEKELAAGILWKRLGVGMLLQVDAAMETYHSLGLPAGPICNPGLESILAAIYPKSNAFWYYLSTKEGETIFNKTLEEHNVAKAKHLR